MAYQIHKYHGRYNITRRTQPARYIAVHYVGSGTSAPGSARANCVYFAGGNRNASANYFVDDAYIYEYADPALWATWHVGDGGGRYGITNGNSIGIEVCINGDRPYTGAEVDRLAWLVRTLMARFGIPASRVVRHYDASRKACPYWYTPYGTGGDRAWEELRRRITTDEEIEEEPRVTIDKVSGGVYRLYNPHANRHHFTADHAEAEALANAGWSYEGAKFRQGSGAQVYRLYNPYDGGHVWSCDPTEVGTLVIAGWDYEGASWRAGAKRDLVRLYDPRGGDHMLALEDEASALEASGWTVEGVLCKVD